VRLLNRAATERSEPPGDWGLPWKSAGQLHAAGPRWNSA